MYMTEKSRKTLVRIIDDEHALHRDSTGIAWVTDGTVGTEYMCHPCIDASGSVSGMKKLGYWKKEAVAVRTHGFVCNISSFVRDENNPYGLTAAKECMCPVCRERHRKERAAEK